MSYFFWVIFNCLGFSLWHLHRKESSSPWEFIAGLKLKLYTTAQHCLAALIRILLVGVIILGVKNEGYRETVRFIESFFFPNNMVLVVVLKVLSIDGCIVFLTIRPISMANK